MGRLLLFSFVTVNTKILVSDNKFSGIGTKLKDAFFPAEKMYIRRKSHRKTQKLKNNLEHP